MKTKSLCVIILSLRHQCFQNIIQQISVSSRIRRWIFALFSAIMLRYLKFIKLLLSPRDISRHIAIASDTFTRQNARTRDTAPIEKLCGCSGKMLLFFSLNRARVFSHKTRCPHSKLAVNERFLGLRDRRTRAITNFRLIQRDSVCLIRFIQSSLRPSGEPHPQEFPVATCQPRVTQC